ncbi:unnamed protein product [Euphydryas editha]|uniref:Uncharacterized protein n=1 Tax=Euphydryas editha TaxID=104508 RepID=A0AAU9TLE2_EUPED|nr:unnamed protein product [Euphydryas editha]
MGDIHKNVTCFSAFDICGNMCEAKTNLHRHCSKAKKRIKSKISYLDSLRRGAGVNVQDDSGYTPLHHACLQGHKSIVHLLLSVDASPCVTNDKGATPLHLAAFKGDSAIVAMLLAHNNPPVNVNQVTLENETALLLAAQFGSVEVVAQLTARGADVNIPNLKDESALDLAAQYGRLQTVKHLIRHHPMLVHPYKFPNWRVRKFSSTPLHRASMNGHIEVVQVLLEAGIDPNVRTNAGTALHQAACFGKADVVRILLEAGADLNAVDGKDKTVEGVLADYPEEATWKVRRVITEFTFREREDDLPPFPVQDSPTGYPRIPVMKAPETQKNNNFSDSLIITPSSSFLTKNSSQNFVKKLASKCLGLKAKFNSAPNISNPGLESNVDGKLKKSDTKLNTNTRHIGNSIFFNILSKKEESGDIICTDEFDTISLDRLGTLNRDSAVNRSNRSCPGFKTSLPNISENNELSDSHESIVGNIDKEDSTVKNNKTLVTEAINYDTKLSIFEPRQRHNRISITSNVSLDSANLVNECYESYEFSSKSSTKIELNQEQEVCIPKPPPRSNLGPVVESEDTIYANIIPERNNMKYPTPAVRTHISTIVDKIDNKGLYENVSITSERKAPEPPKRSFMPFNITSNYSSPSGSRSSTLSSDSMIDESNLEDILLSEKSKSFRHRKIPLHRESSKSSINRAQSNASDISNTTEISALENVDCSGDIENKSIYLSMTGTLPNKKTDKVKKKVLFRNKTFTNIEVDRNSVNTKNTIKQENSFLKETLGKYHIRGTGHCMYKAPTVQEFIYIFNRDTLYTDVEPFTKVPNDKRDSYFETGICFCKPRPPKFHSSAEDLLDIPSQEEEDKVSIDMDALKNKLEFVSSSFRCFCDSGTCPLHENKRKTSIELVVKFSAIKKSISTPDITLELTPSSTITKSRLIKNKSVPSNLEEPYAVVNIQDVIKKSENACNTDLKEYGYVAMSPHSSLSSTDRPYSVKDIAEVISLGTNSTSTDANVSCASSDTMQSVLRKSSSSEHSGHWSLQSCNSNITIVSDASFKSCIEESSDDSDGTLHSDGESSDAETVKSDVSTTKRPWVHSSSFRFGNKHGNKEIKDTIDEDESFALAKFESSSSKIESGISVDSESYSSECEGDSGVPGEGYVSLDASLERDSGVVGAVRSGSGRRRWDEAEGTSEGDALSVSSAASSCAPLHLAHHHEYSKVSPTPPKKPPRRNLSVSPTHVNSPSSGYSYELRAHARSQDDLDEIQGAKHYLKHGRSVDQYVDSKLSSEYEENHNSPRAIPVPNPRPSLRNRSQPVAITAMYENVVIKEQNPRRKLRRNTFGPQYENFEVRMADKRVRKYSNQERSSLESLLDDQSMNSPSECERYSDGSRVDIPLSPTHYEQPPTPDHPPPSAKQAENSIHERIRPLSQLIMEVVEEIRIMKKSQGDSKS